MTFGEKLKAIRIKAECSQEETETTGGSRCWDISLYDIVAQLRKTNKR
ncbi:hypothetical protein K400107F7_06150 [Agathobaculum massiliense]